MHFVFASAAEDVLTTALTPATQTEPALVGEFVVFCLYAELKDI
jgi:hypothetical protein